MGFKRCPILAVMPAVTVVRAEAADLAIPTRVVRECAALSAALETGGVCRLPDGVTSRRLMRVVKYYEDCFLPEHTVYARTTGFFRSLQLSELRELMEAAHALGANGLLDLAVLHVARMLTGSSPVEILHVLGLNADTTAEEQGRRRVEMGWALDQTAT